VAIPAADDERAAFFKEAERICNRRLRYVKWNSRIVRLLPIKLIPGFHKAVKDYRDYMLHADNYGKTGMYYIVAGPLALRDRATYGVDLFEKMVDVEFEHHKFWAISEYDAFLTLRYGDYMQLPPESERHPYHGGRYFWK
jgi:phosphorylcholine metabolism protein LicD